MMKYRLLLLLLLFSVMPAMSKGLSDIEYYFLSIDSMTKGQYEMATEYLRQAIAIYDKDPLYHLHLADIYRLRGMHDQATLELNKVVKNNKDSRYYDITSAVYAKILSQTKNPHPAALKYYELLQKEGQLTALNKVIGQIYYREKDYKQAVTYLSLAYKEYPRDREILKMLALSYINTAANATNCNNAMQYLDALDISADRGVAMGALKCYLTLQKTDEFNTLMSQLMKSDTLTASDYVSIYEILKPIYPDQASKAIQKAYQADPNDIRVIEISAEYHMQKKDYANARLMYEKLSISDPHNEKYLSQLYEISLKQRSPENAKIYLQKLNEISPKPSYQVALGDIYKVMNLHSNAYQSYYKALEMDGGLIRDRAFMERYAENFEKMGKVNEAMKIWQDIYNVTQDPRVQEHIWILKSYAVADDYMKELNALYAKKQAYEAQRNEAAVEDALLKIAQYASAHYDTSQSKTAYAELSEKYTKQEYISKYIALLIETGDIPQANIEIEEYRRKGFDNAEMDILEGHMSRASGDNNMAISMYSQALRQDIHSVDAMNALADIYISQKRYKDANNIVQAWLGMYPDDKNALQYKSQIAKSQPKSKNYVSK